MIFGDSTRDKLETFYARCCKDQLDHLVNVYPDEKAFFIDYGLLELFDLGLVESMDNQFVCNKEWNARYKKQHTTQIQASWPKGWVI